MRNENGIAQGEGVVLPTWLFAGAVGLLLGIVLGPTLLSSTREGSQYLAKLAEERIKGK